MITERELAVLRAVRELTDENSHIPPTLREIGDRTGITSTSLVDYYLDNLADAGLVERFEAIARGTVITPMGVAYLQNLCACGKPLTEPYAKEMKECVACRLGRIRRGRTVHLTSQKEREKAADYRRRRRAEGLKS